LTHFRRQGAFILPMLDSGSAETRWHKLVIDGERPQGTEFRIQYLISQKSETVSELQNLPVAHWSDAVVNFSDALFPEEIPAGRFLAVRGELATNNPQVTPKLKALTAVFPRQSYLRFLPASYQGDPVSRTFLERFLGIFETLTGKLDSAIDDTSRVIDPAAAPAEFLPWLSGWMALGLDEGWSEAQKRLFLQDQQRGTREGISRSVEIITGKRPLILEPFQLDCIDDPALREEYARVYAGDECHFCLLLDPQAGQQENALSLVRRIVEEQVPAHVLPGVVGLRCWFHLGMPTYLEINTLLNRPIIRLGESVLAGGETGLTDQDEAGQIERKTRIGTDTTLT
jgi:phage tail-like protein